MWLEYVGKLSGAEIPVGGGAAIIVPKGEPKDVPDSLAQKLLEEQPERWKRVAGEPEPGPAPAPQEEEG